MEEGWNFEVTKNVISNPPIFLPDLTDLTNFLSRLVLMSQLFGKKINSQKSKKTLFLEFPIFLPEITGSTNFLFKASSYEPAPREKDKNSRWQKAPYQFFLFSCQS